MLLFGLVLIGTTLFMLLMICLIITCVKKKRINQNAIAPTMNIIQRRISGSAHHSVSSQADRKAMIQDTSSEVSEESDPVPYFRKVSFIHCATTSKLIQLIPIRNLMTKRSGKSPSKLLDRKRRNLSRIIPSVPLARQRRWSNVTDL